MTRMVELQVVLVLEIARFLIRTTDTAARPKIRARATRLKVTRLRVRLRAKDILPKAKATRLRATLHSSSTVKVRRPK